EREDIQLSTRSAGGLFHPLEPGAAWMQAMAGAFSSDRLDDYTDRLRTVDRAVARRYGLSDPSLVVDWRDENNLPANATWDSFRYAKLAIASGDALEAHGDSNGAIEKYLTVIHFLHAVNSHGTYPFFFDSLMPTFYTRLATVYKKMGNTPQSAYFAGLAVTARHEWEQHGLQWRSEMENRGSISGVTPWNALVVEASNVAMLASFSLLLIALIVVLARSRTLRPSGLRMGPVATALGFLGSVGLLVSSVALYVAYRPYAAIYSNFIQTGDASQLAALREFLEFTRSPIGTQMYRPLPGHHGVFAISPYVSTHAFTFYFWLAVTVLGVASLAAMGGWHLVKRFRTRAGASA
ncbi:MAG TPA: hypothetical protein VFJ52_04390, partial [Terriglobia bacterium]|nr:hypothetical protein [Terriglobia bacterium]